MRAIEPTPAQSLAASALAELATLGLDMARAVTGIAKVEQRAVAAVARWLPADDAEPASLEEATRIGRDIDAADQALAHAVPRVTTLAAGFDRIARAVRRTVALARRIEQGWPRPAALADDRRALLLRQAVRDARETIRARTEGDAEAAERLFADLDARLEDPAFTADLLEHEVEQVVRTLCRAIGLSPEDPGATRQPAPATGPPPLLGEPRRDGHRRRSGHGSPPRPS